MDEVLLVKTIPVFSVHVSYIVDGIDCSCVVACRWPHKERLRQRLSQYVGLKVNPGIWNSNRKRTTRCEHANALGKERFALPVSQVLEKVRRVDAMHSSRGKRESLSEIPKDVAFLRYIDGDPVVVPRLLPAPTSIQISLGSARSLLIFALAACSRRYARARELAKRTTFAASAIIGSSPQHANASSTLRRPAADGCNYEEKYGGRAGSGSRHPE